LKTNFALLKKVTKVNRVFLPSLTKEQATFISSCHDIFYRLLFPELEIPWSLVKEASPAACTPERRTLVKYLALNVQKYRQDFKVVLAFLVSLLSICCSKCQKQLSLAFQNA
jgi:hypothetical protein